MKNLIILFIATLLFLQSCTNTTKNNTTESVESSAEYLTKNSQANSGNSQLLFENDSIAIYRIDSVFYFQNREKFFLQKDTIPYIEDLDESKRLLGNRITFGGWDNNKNKVDSLLVGDMLAKVRFDNGKIVDASHDDGTILNEAVFVRYYPSEEILLLEGGHTSDFSIDFKNRNMGSEIVGNPEYINYSPQKSFRLNGYFPGQECSSYFIQQLGAKSYTHYAYLPMHLTDEGFDLCTINEVFWVSENELNFRNTYFGTTEDKRLGFFRLIIKELP